MKKTWTLLTILCCALALSMGCDDKEKAADQAEQAAPEGTDQAGSAEQTADEGDEAAEQEGEEIEGQWVESSTYNLKFRVPEDWNVVLDEQGASATDSDGTTTVLLVGTKSQGLTTAMLNEMRADLKFKDLEIEKTGPTIINGMSVFRGEGSAVAENPEMDQEIQFLGYTIKRSGDQMATLFIFSQAEMYEAKKELIQGIAQTLVEMSN